MLRKFTASSSRFFSAAASASVASEGIQPPPPSTAAVELPPPSVQFIVRTEWDSPTLRPALSRLSKEYGTKYFTASSPEQADAVLNEIVQWSVKIRDIGIGQLPLFGVIRRLSIDGIDAVPLIDKYFDVEEFELIRNDPRTLNLLINIYFSSIVSKISNLYKNEDEELANIVRLLKFADSLKCNVQAKLPLYIYIATKKDVSFIVKLVGQLNTQEFTMSIIISELILHNNIDKTADLLNQKISYLFLSRMDRSFSSALQAQPLTEATLQTMAKIVNFGFTGRSEHALQFMKTLLLDTNIPDENLRKLFEHLKDAPQVHLNRQSREVLKDGIPESRAELIDCISKPVSFKDLCSKKSVDELIRIAETKEHLRSYDKFTLLSYLITKAHSDRRMDIVRSNMAAFSEALKHLNERQRENKAAVIEIVQRICGQCLNEAIQDGNWDQVDALWECNSNSRPHQALAYALYLSIRGDLDKAAAVLEAAGQEYYEKNNRHYTAQEITLRQIMERADFSNATSDNVKNYVNLVEKNFALPANTIMAAAKKHAKTASVAALIKSKNLKDAFVNLKATAKDAVFLYGETMDLLKAAVESNDGELVRDVSTFVTQTYSAVSLYGMLGTVLLELNNDKGIALYQAIQAPHAKLMEKILAREEKLKRPDVIHKMFTTFNKAEVSTVDLIMLVRRAVKLYAESGQYDGIRQIADEVRQSSLPVTTDLRQILERHRAAS